MYFRLLSWVPPQLALSSFFSLVLVSVVLHRFVAIYYVLVGAAISASFLAASFEMWLLSSVMLNPGLCIHP